MKRNLGYVFCFIMLCGALFLFGSGIYRATFWVIDWWAPGRTMMLISQGLFILFVNAAIGLALLYLCRVVYRNIKDSK